MDRMHLETKLLALLSAVFLLGGVEVSGQTATEIRPYPDEPVLKHVRRFLPCTCAGRRTIYFFDASRIILYCHEAMPKILTAARTCDYQSAPTQGCYLAEYRDKHLAFGQSWPVPGQCMSMTCEETSQMPNGKKAFVLYYAGCGSVAAMKPCWVVADSRKPHPQCCPRIKCPNGELNSNSVYDFK